MHRSRMMAFYTVMGSLAVKQCKCVNQILALQTMQMCKPDDQRRRNQNTPAFFYFCPYPFRFLQLQRYFWTAEAQSQVLSWSGYLQITEQSFRRTVKIFKHEFFFYLFWAEGSHLSSLYVLDALQVHSRSRYTGHHGYCAVGNHSHKLSISLSVFLYACIQSRERNKAVNQRQCIISWIYLSQLGPAWLDIQRLSEISWVI